MSSSSSSAAAPRIQPLTYCPFDFVPSKIHQASKPTLPIDIFAAHITPYLDDIDSARCRGVCSAFYRMMWTRSPSVYTTSKYGVFVCGPKNLALPDNPVLEPRRSKRLRWTELLSLFDQHHRGDPDPSIQAIRSNFARAKNKIGSGSDKLHSILNTLHGHLFSTAEKKIILRGLLIDFEKIFRTSDLGQFVEYTSNYDHCIRNKHAIQLLKKFGSNTAAIFYLLNQEQQRMRTLFLCHQPDGSPFGQACAAMRQKWGIENFNDPLIGPAPTFAHAGHPSTYFEYLDQTNNILFQTYFMRVHFLQLHDCETVLDEMIPKALPNPEEQGRYRRTYQAWLCNSETHPISSEDLYTFSSTLMQQLGFLTPVDNKVLAKLDSRLQSSPLFYRSLEDGFISAEKLSVTIPLAAADMGALASALIVRALWSCNEDTEDKKEAFNIVWLLKNSPILKQPKRIAFDLCVGYHQRIQRIKELLQQHYPGGMVVPSAIEQNEAKLAVISKFSSWIALPEAELSSTIKAYVQAALAANRASLLTGFKNSWNDAHTTITRLRMHLEPAPVVDRDGDVVLEPVQETNVLEQIKASTSMKELTQLELQHAISTGEILSILRTENLPASVVTSLLDGLKQLSDLQRAIKDRFAEFHEPKDSPDALQKPLKRARTEV